VEAWADHWAVPRVIFTDPEVASVGPTERAAGDQCLEVRTVSYPFGSMAAASVGGEGIAGTAHLVVDDRQRVVVGATFTGPDIAELLHSATIAIAGAVPLDLLWHAVPAFPTFSEVWLRLLETYGL
jgi:pyruvate/2-oxoglutarate dehydrogenase complex dihydrolipoamide dehydrogenase (E3) component